MKPSVIIESGDPIANSTLGVLNINITSDRWMYIDSHQFQEIFALVLPHRQDRARPLLAAANATNITITIFDAIADVNVTEQQSPQVC